MVSFSAFQKMLRAPRSLLLLPLAYVWFVAINHLRLEWTLNPQYAYGWAVPFLCLFLVWEARGREQGAGGKRPRDDRTIDHGPERAERGEPTHYALRTTHHALPTQPSCQCFSISAFQLFILSAFLPIRLIQEANPDWRLVSWALAGEAVGLTLLTIFFLGGSAAVRRYAFAVAFFFLAVPWPGFVEQPLIQGLARINTACAVELSFWFGTPAVQQGNVVEITSGLVGIDDACSGIRSLQATLMISLFLGELYRLPMRCRLLLCGGGLLLAFGFNVARTFFLVQVASANGMTAIDRWHDPAGIGILLLCFGCLWLLGAWMRTGARERTTEVGERRAEDGRAKDGRRENALRTTHYALRITPAFQLLPPLIALAWFGLVEAGTAMWYGSHETASRTAVSWSVQWPTNAVGFEFIRLPERTRQMLRCDVTRSARWVGPDNIAWQMHYLRWEPGKTAAALAHSHRPEICLPAAGWRLISRSAEKSLAMQGLTLPYRSYVFAEGGRVLHVFYGFVADAPSQQDWSGAGLTYRERLRAVWEGRRNLGQQVIETAVMGFGSAAEAEAAFREMAEGVFEKLKY